MKNEVFGISSKSEKAELITLNNGIISCEIISFGATLRSLFVPDKNGIMRDVVLGYDSLFEYEQNDGYLGATVGRYANRIKHGSFQINDTCYNVDINDEKNHLHGGTVGFSHRMWDVILRSDTSVTLRLFSPDGDGGYPGNLTAFVTYTLDKSALVIEYSATCDEDTICNLTNHSYFNLNGHNSGDVLNQKLAICADYYTPTDVQSIPTGKLESVVGTPMNFKTLHYVKTHINDKFIQLTQAKGYDHNYVINGVCDSLRLAARAKSTLSGISMEVYTTKNGVQFYTANYLTKRAGKGGVMYDRRHGFCLETQFFPDSPNHKNFPSPILHKGKTYNHKTIYKFSK